MRKLFTIVLIFISVCTFSQKYNQSAGIRGGYTSGVTIKKFLTDIKSMEAIVSGREGGMQLTVIRQYHEISFLAHTDNLFFIHGYGGHAGFHYTNRGNFLFMHWQSDQKKLLPIIGLDAYFGFEFRSIKLPITFGLDYKPCFGFSAPIPFYMNLVDFAGFIKYAF